MIYLKKRGVVRLSVILLLIIPYFAFTQNIQPSGRFDTPSHHEFIDDPYVAASLAQQERSPAYHYRGSSFFTIQVNVDEYGDNIMNDAANEPSIAIDPANPDKMVIGWRQFDNVESNFRQAGYAYTTDGGESWTFPGVIEPGVFRSDPVLSYDVDGNIYYNSLTTDFDDHYWCHVFIMDEQGTEWDEGTYAQGGDKQWMEIDRTEGIGAGNIYSNWTSNYSICYPNFFTRSTDGGAFYEDCIFIPGNPRYATLDVDAQGTLYVAGDSWEGFIFSKSYNAQDSEQMIIWQNYKVIEMGGDLISRIGPNPGGLLGQVWVAADKSDGPNGGNIYILCSVDPFGSDPLDVMLVRSTDGGETWSDPVRVNDDNENDDNWQWFGTMSVAPDGRIDIVWLDTRDAIPGSYESSLYYCYSVDGGLTFSENERVSELFDPHVGWPNQQKMGDYYHMISDLDGAHLAWANTLNGEQDVYYTYINPWFVGLNENSTQQEIALSAFPNPSSGEVTLRYRMAENDQVKIVLYNIYGKMVKVLAHEHQTAGLHTLRFDGTGLPAGVYTCRVQSGASSAAAKITLLK